MKFKTMTQYEIVEEDTGKGKGRMMLFKTDEPVDVLDWDDEVKVTTQYFVASATVVPMGGGAETYVFPADEDGEIIDWGELPGSQKGPLDPEGTAERFVNEIEDGTVSY